MFKLGSSVRLVILQFSFTNPQAVPEVILGLPKETEAESAARKGRAPTGTMVIEPVEGVSVALVAAKLQAAGYELVDAKHQERVNWNNPQGKPCHTCRFIFCRREQADPSQYFRTIRRQIIDGLDGICLVALWRVRGFENPFFSKGQAVAGTTVLSLNMEVRTPLFQADGQPVMIRAKDPNTGKRSGKPEPLASQHRLEILDNIVQVTAV